MFSDAVNELLAGNSVNLDEAPQDSVFGILRDQLVGDDYDKDHFPALSEVFERFAARVGDPIDWGKVPLSVTRDSQPTLLPLQVAYETRSDVDRILARFEGNRARCLHASTLALAQVLRAMRKMIDPKVAILLALETVNGTAKTTPITDKVMKSLGSE